MSDDLFGIEGNFEDYWLGQAHYTNTFVMDDVGWESADDYLRRLDMHDQREWNAPPLFTGENRDTIRKIIADEPDERGADKPSTRDRAGGFIGMDPEFNFVRGRLLARGRLGLDIESGKRR